MDRKGSLLSAEAGIKKARLILERITDAQAAMTNIVECKRCKDRTEKNFPPNF